MREPKLIRAGSHSCNVAAAHLAEIDQLDIFLSDYVPTGLLMAAVQLGYIFGNIARGMHTVTASPTRAIRLTDRGTRSSEKGQTLYRLPSANINFLMTKHVVRACILTGF
jgi:alpha-D-ribose 1-methylphosphonate 5-triphosphate diphosphatase PhnM